MQPFPLRLLPDSAEVVDGRLQIGGCDLLDLAAEFGTPLFVYDEQQLRDRCREAVAVFGDGVAYATKAFLCTAMARLAHEEGMDLDVATGGELHVALACRRARRSAGAPRQQQVDAPSCAWRSTPASAGSWSTPSTSSTASTRWRAETGSAPKVLLRLTPGVEGRHPRVRRDRPRRLEVRLHGLAPAPRPQAIERARNADSVELVGVHAHIGSQVFVVVVVRQGGGRDRRGAPRPTTSPEMSVGGGLGVPYVADERAPTITEWGDRSARGLCRAPASPPRVSAEPGRSIAAAAAVTLYEVGTIKRLPGIRTYVSVDGGMSDNPRPVLYGSGYETFLPRAVEADRARDGHRSSASTASRATCSCATRAVPADLAVGDILGTAGDRRLRSLDGLELQQGPPAAGGLRVRRRRPARRAPRDLRRPDPPRRLSSMGSLRRADVLWRATLDGVLIRPLGAAELTKLAGTGRALWAVLEEPASFDEVCELLAEIHDADAAAIAADLVPVVDDLVARGVLERLDG